MKRENNEDLNEEKNRKEVFRLRELEPVFRNSIKTYQRTQAAEEGRIISFSKALKEYNSGIYRGIQEYMGIPRRKPDNNHMGTIVYGTKDVAIEPKEKVAKVFGIR